jgi:hypothetical protein
VRDLLGDVTILEVEPDLESLGFYSVGASSVAISPTGVAKYDAALETATAEAFADPAHVATFLPCIPTGIDDDACQREAISAFGRRAWKRPLVDDEIGRYVDIAKSIATETGDMMSGLRYAVWGLLGSPYFLYRVELGEPSLADPTRFHYTPYETASRLAYTLWNTSPDDALLDAAASGELSTMAGRKFQVERMLADSKAHQGIANFAAELYGLWRLTNTVKDPELYPMWTPSLADTMREDLLSRVDDVVLGQPRDYLSLYDGRKVFVNNALAKIYGLPESPTDTFRAVELPETEMRRGLIASGLVLAAYSTPVRTSATLRGKFIAETFLCATIPPPPANVDTKLEDPPSGPVTLRQKLEPHRSDPGCSGCHAIMDPIGLGLENFDTIGAYRESDSGLPIDASGELDGAFFDDAAGLASRLRQDSAAIPCLVRKLYTYVAGRAPAAAEEEWLKRLETALSTSGNRLDEVLVALVASDDFQVAGQRP